VIQQFGIRAYDLGEGRMTKGGTRGDRVEELEKLDELTEKLTGLDRLEECLKGLLTSAGV